MDLDALGGDGDPRVTGEDGSHPLLRDMPKSKGRCCRPGGVCSRRSTLAAGAVSVAAVVVAAVVIAVVFAARHDDPIKPDATVILISLDGFRWDYFGRVPTPALDWISGGGVKATSMIPIFPTLTFPNHYTLVTGLYAESHGIVDNQFWSPEFNETYSAFDDAITDEAKWWGGEPIWVTAELQNKTAGVMFWPGSNAPIMGVRPTYWAPYNKTFGYSKRVDRVLGWLDGDEGARPSFVAMYFSAVDSAGHYYGPNSTEVDEAILYVDATIQELINGLQDRGIENDTHIIVVSDHGMVEVESAIRLAEFIDLVDNSTALDASPASNERQRSDSRHWRRGGFDGGVGLSPSVFADDGGAHASRGLKAVPSVPARVEGLSPVTAVWPLDGDEETILTQLGMVGNNYTVWRKEDIPERLHYRNNDRIPPIVGLASPPWVVTFNKSSASGGAHGYDNEVMDMHAIFLARGPAIKPGAALGSFENVNVYPLVCHLLGLDPAPSNGTVDVFSDILA